MRLARLAIVLALPAIALARPDFTARGPLEAVGVRTVPFVKPSETTGAPRRLDTVVWYPAVAGTGTLEGEVLRDARVLRGRFPLVVFSHGSCGFPGQSEFLTITLASYGFVVAAPPHPGNTSAEIPDCFDALADSFANRVADLRFVIEGLLAAARDPASPFARHIHPRRIGVTGHSYGGQTTLRMAALGDRRIRGAVALAPAVVREIPGLQIAIPTMVITGEVDDLTPFETDARGAFAMLSGPRYLVKLLDTGHCAFAPLCAPMFCGTGCEPGRLSIEAGHDLTLRLAVPFFLRYVAGRARYARDLRPRAAPDGAVFERAEPRPLRGAP
jgi:predicted dienelactone hydrolase